MNLFILWPLVYFGIILVLFILLLLRAQFKTSNIVIFLNKNSLNKCLSNVIESNKKKVQYLEDNHPMANYKYIITVFTGFQRNSYSNAKISIKLIGY